MKKKTTFVSLLLSQLQFDYSIAGKKIGEQKCRV